MRVIILLLYFFSTSVSAQRFQVTSSTIQFFSEAPLENIYAENHAVKSILDTASKAIAIIIPIKSFEFEKKLMQEHFNENYLESDKYPQATFKGRIQNISGLVGSYKARAIGELALHGITRDVEIEGEMIYDGTKYTLLSQFFIRLEDYNIKIPKAVFYNIAEEVEVTVTLVYLPYEKN